MKEDLSSDAAEPASPPIRVLVVDNDEALARAMEEALVKVGYQCVVATSGPEGARRIEQDTFDIIVTDLVMNDLDGMEVLSRARPKGALGGAGCLEVLRALSAAAASHNKVVRSWSEYDFEFGVLFGAILVKCARAKPDKGECDYRQLDIDDPWEFSPLRMRLGASVIRSDWQLADKAVGGARELLAVTGTAEHANQKVPRSERAVGGSVIGRAVDLLCVGDSVPSDAIEPCRDLRDILIQGVADDEESDVNAALSGLVDAYQLRPNE